MYLWLSCSMKTRNKYMESKILSDIRLPQLAKKYIKSSMIIITKFQYLNSVVDSDLHHLGSWIRIRITVKSRIRICIKVKRWKHQRFILTHWRVQIWKKWVVGSGSALNWNVGSGSATLILNCKNISVLFSFKKVEKEHLKCFHLYFFQNYNVISTHSIRMRILHTNPDPATQLNTDSSESAILFGTQSLFKGRRVSCIL